MHFAESLDANVIVRGLRAVADFEYEFQMTAMNQRLNDRIETVAVKGVFGNLAKQVPFSSVKSMLGHLIQAAGAVELMTCVKAIETGWVPPTMNLNSPDPECDLDYVPNAARDLRPMGGVDACLSNSFGFGGQNNTLCVRRFRA